MKDDFFTLIGAVVAAIAIVIIMPFVIFWCAWLGGWIASHVIGNQLCYALNALFKTNHFTPEMIPWFAAALGWIGGYFKTVSLKSNNK